MSINEIQVTEKDIQNALMLARIERAKAFRSFFAAIPTFFKGLVGVSVPNNADHRTV